MQIGFNMSSTSNSLSFDGLRFFFISKKIGKTQRQILIEKIIKFGGTIVNKISQSTTHVLLHRDVSLEDGLKYANIAELPVTVKTVKIEWVSYCIFHQKILDTSTFEVII